MPGVTDYVAPSHQEVNILLKTQVLETLTMQLLPPMPVLLLSDLSLKSLLEEFIRTFLLFFEIQTIS